MLYLDNAATTPVRREVLEAMWPYLTAEFGNPSSHHTVGERAAAALADARASVASLLGGRSSDIIFTAGGTEGANLAIKGIALATPRGKHLVTSPIEHEAVLESIDYLVRLHGFEATMVKLDRAGQVHRDALAAALRPDTTLVSVMYANNEIGTVNPIGSLSAGLREARVPFHTDAVQAAGWLDLNTATLGVDALTISGHKIGAPKGIGVAFIRGRIPVEPLIHGGGQERGRRSGTENVAFAVGFATALQLAESERSANVERLVALRESLIRQVLRSVPSAFLTGHTADRLAHHASFCFPRRSGEAVLLELERRGIVSSSGSACAAGSDEPSHVLVGIGLDPAVAQTAVRITLSSGITEEQIDRTAHAIADSVAAVAPNDVS